MNAEMEVLAYEASTAAYDLGRAMALGVDVEAAKLADEQAVTALVDAIVNLETENVKLKSEIENLKAERRWIPVSERLPKTSPVLVLTVDGEITSGMLTEDGWTNPRFDFAKDEVACWHEFCDEIPLPEPPEVK